MEKTSTGEQTDAQHSGDSARAFRAQLHGMWAAVADGWAEHADYVDSRSAEITERMLALTAPRPGQRVLELACGPGSVGLAAAELVEPGGEVVLSDVVVEMTNIAAARAEARGIRNVRTALADVEQIGEPDDSYDVVLCREGLMFAPDPGRAMREIRRVLRPGGRMAIAVWGPRARNPWLAVMLDAVGAQLGAPVPPPGVPGPFSLEDAASLSSLISGAGLAEVAIEEVEAPIAASFEEWWTNTRALAGPLSKILDALPAEDVEAIREKARSAMEPYQAEGVLRLPGVTLLASACRS